MCLFVACLYYAVSVIISVRACLLCESAGLCIMCEVCDVCFYVCVCVLFATNLAPFLRVHSSCDILLQGQPSAIF